MARRRPRSSAGPLHPRPHCPLSFCTSAGNVPLTYIFFQTYVTFFFFLWEETGENPRKREAVESGARKNTGSLFTKLLQTPSQDRCADRVQGGARPAFRLAEGGSECEWDDGEIASPAEELRGGLFHPNPQQPSTGVQRSGQAGRHLARPAGRGEPRPPRQVHKGHRLPDTP